MGYVALDVLYARSRRVGRSVVSQGTPNYIGFGFGFEMLSNAIAAETRIRVRIDTQGLDQIGRAHV